MTTYIVFRDPPKQLPADFQQQLERLLEKEKIARINNEHFTSVTVLKDIITLCYQAAEWQRLQQQLAFLMNRRGQSKKAQIEMIQLAMSWLPTIPHSPRSSLVLVIRDLCAKKIFLEVEYARCVLMIVKAKENDNDLMEAAAILQEVQVETYGSMDKREKVEFILYQMKIMLKKQDFVRFFIISKKINPASLNASDIADLKLTYHSYLAIYYNHEGRISECCAAYKALSETLSTTKQQLPEVLDFGFSAKPIDILSNYVALLTLQPYSETNNKELRILSERADAEKSPHLMYLINKFLSEEIVSCRIEDYQPQSFQLFRSDFPRSSAHLLQLRKMLVQHNIRMIANYYSLLTLPRVAQLLRVEQDYCQEQICVLNNSGIIKCRIDRIAATVDFSPLEDEQAKLKQWNSSVNQILDLVDVATNLIRRQREVYSK